MQPDRKWTIIDGKMYDITDFLPYHPGGERLLSLAVGRDASILFHSYHTKTDRPTMIVKALPTLEMDQSFTVKQRATPSESSLYLDIKERVRKEILPLASARVGWKNHIALLAWLVFLPIYMFENSLLSGLILGVIGAWVGVSIQHTANHGAWSFWGNLCASTNDVVCGGSSLIWRYHHQVGHHLHTNDIYHDQDVFSSYPLLRLDIKQECKPYHKWQWLYAPLLFPFLYLSIQWQDWSCFLYRRCYQVKMHGLNRQDRIEFLVGKLVHYLIMIVLPLWWHGWNALLPLAGFTTTGSFLLSILFIVSHNVVQTKMFGATTDDWAINQIQSSANWGGKMASFLTGGLNYQIEHHLFPGLSHKLYPLIAPIVRDECGKAQVKYCHFETFGQIWMATVLFLYYMGQDDTQMS